MTAASLVRAKSFARDESVEPLGAHAKRTRQGERDVREAVNALDAPDVSNATHVSERRRARRMRATLATLRAPRSGEQIVCICFFAVRVRATRDAWCRERAIDALFRGVLL
jgi:hypothetical protein